MDRLEETRLSWIKLYKEVKDAGIVCRRCGISRTTLRKWLQRYEKSGVDGLKELSRKLHNCQSKITDQIDGCVQKIILPYNFCKDGSRVEKSIVVAKRLILNTGSFAIFML